MVDSALTAFLKIRVDLHHANKNYLKQFNSAPKMVEAFGPDFEVQMGFGMHIGWAIEVGGTVGEWVGGYRWIQFIKTRHLRSQQAMVRPPSFALTYSLTHAGSNW